MELLGVEGVFIDGFLNLYHVLHLFLTCGFVLFVRLIV